MTDDLCEHGNNRDNCGGDCGKCGAAGLMCDNTCHRCEPGDTPRELRAAGLCTEHDGDHVSAPCCGACDFLCECPSIERDEAQQ